MKGVQRYACHHETGAFRPSHVPRGEDKQDLAGVDDEPFHEA